MKYEDALAPWAPKLLSVLRIMTALLFLAHGTQKFFDFPGPVPALTPLMIAAGTIEIIGSILLAIGLFSRAAAFIMSGEMAVAYFVVFFPRGFYPLLNGGESAVLFCFIFLYIAAAGPGPWSVDAIARGRR